MSRDYVGVPAKDVTGREMLGALASYVWPKVSYGVRVCVYCGAYTSYDFSIDGEIVQFG